MAEPRYKTKEKILQEYNTELEKELEEAQLKLQQKETYIKLLRRENVLLLDSKVYTVAKVPIPEFIRYISHFYDTDLSGPKIRTGNPLKARKFLCYFLKYYYRLGPNEISSLINLERTTVRKHAQAIKEQIGLSILDRQELIHHRNYILS